MSRKPIQVPIELKDRVESMKVQLHAKTEYEVIERLIAYYDKQPNHVLLEDEVRNTFRNLKLDMKLRSDSDFVRLLLEHYIRSDSMSMELFDLYVKLRG